MIKMRTVKKVSKIVLHKYLRSYSFFKNKKCRIPFLPFYTFSACFNKICPKEWLWALMGKLILKIITVFYAEIIVQCTQRFFLR
jgi:hypothetical protein